MASSYFAIDDRIIYNGIFKCSIGPGRPKFKKGNQLIIFDKSSDGVFFWGTSEAVETKEMSKENENVRFCMVTIAPAIDFSKPRPLSVLSGSLEKVYRFLEPEKHFRRKIVALSQRDFLTITKETLDISRSVFRYLFSALPLEIQTEFIAANAHVIPGKSGSKIRNYFKLANTLVSFLEERVSQRLDLLAMLPKIYEQIPASGKPSLNKLYLASENVSETIAFGEVAIDTRGLLKSNYLFAPLSEGSSILKHCKTQLAEQDEDAYIREYKKRWNETFF